METNCAIHWIEIYPVDSAIRRLNNRDLAELCSSTGQSWPVARGAGMQATFAWMKCENGVVWHAQKNFHQYYFFLVWELEMIIVGILIAMKYIVNGALQKHMVFFLFYQNLVGQVVGNKALMGIA